jgi:DNA-directed RNA polymerase specialized sigma24 family protein
MDRKSIRARLASEPDAMDNQPAQKQAWVLTHEALDKLLAQLDADRDRAAEKYEQIRQRLMKLFKWRGCLRFEEYTDKTIDRVAQRIAEGAKIQTPNPYTLFYGVAMNLLKEHWRKVEREAELLDDLLQAQTVMEDPEDVRVRKEKRVAEEARIICLRHCLEELSCESLTLIKKYYTEGDLLDKQQRKQMADELRISVNALRVRAYRIRSEVEQCVENCLKPSG